MRRRLGGVLLLFACALASAAPPEGRWEGAIHIPGRELALVVDLAPGAAGAWTGSLVIPGLGVKGEPLANVVVANAKVAFEVGGSLRGADDGPTAFSGRITRGGDTIEGEFTQGANVAKFELRKTGEPQVESPERSTAVRSDVAGEWTGQFELGGYPRNLTIRFENRADGVATAKLVIVGKRTTDVPIDLVVDEGDFVRIESRANRLTFEGRFVKETSEIRGTIDLGALELPVVLRRAAARAS